MGMKARDMTEAWWDERYKLLERIIRNAEVKKDNHGYRIMGDGSIRVCWLDTTKGWKYSRRNSPTEWHDSV